MFYTFFYFFSGNNLPSINIKRQKSNLNFKIMERKIRFEMAKRNLEELISKLSENEILNPDAMSCVRGGDGEGAGGEPIIIPPIQT